MSLPVESILQSSPEPDTQSFPPTPAVWTGLLPPRRLKGKGEKFGQELTAHPLGDRGLK